jgi:hypothetical protein
MGERCLAISTSRRDSFRCDSLGGEMFRSLGWIGLALMLVAVPRAQTDLATLGPQIGQRALDISLPDQMGRVRTLSSVAGPKGTMLVFFRSADW